MKKYTVKLSTAKNLRGWPENNLVEKFDLCECTFFAENKAVAEAFLVKIKEAYRVPPGILAQEFILYEN